MRVSVNHKGDSDSTGAICGNLSQNVSCLFFLSYNVLQIVLHGCSLIIGIYDIL
ncbi:ADP-ribosylglycohydrolase family protein [Fusicatenibacter sp. CLA-AA-H241]|nr:ADP-ribosylglycohydrolase family protein [Oliverpabstia intestinalis]